MYEIIGYVFDTLGNPMKLKRELFVNSYQEAQETFIALGLTHFIFTLREVK